MIATTDSKLIVVDSCGWIEYLTDGERADAFAVYLNDTEQLLVPATVVYEVYKKLFQTKGSALADVFMSYAFTFKDHFIPLDVDLSVRASRLGVDNHLAMADALIYATALRYEAKLITSDAHFANLPGVTLV